LTKATQEGEKKMKEKEEEERRAQEEADHGNELHEDVDEHADKDEL